MHIQNRNHTHKNQQFFAAMPLYFFSYKAILARNIFKNRKYWKSSVSKIKQRAATLFYWTKIMHLKIRFNGNFSCSSLRRACCWSWRVACIFAWNPWARKIKILISIAQIKSNLAVSDGGILSSSLILSSLDGFSPASGGRWTSPANDARFLSSW